MSEKHHLEATARTDSAGRVRAAGNVPGVLYGHGITNELLQVDRKQFTKLFTQAGSTSLVSLVLDGTSHNVLIREVQWHPVGDQVTHVDFYQVRLDEKVRTRVPLRFEGEAVAVKDLGGVLIKSLDELEVEALPQDLPHDIPVDISKLVSFATVLHVRDLALPPKVELHQALDDIVVLVQPPRSEQELESLKEAVTEDVAAVEAVKKEKPEEEEAAATGEEAGKEAATPPAK